jgi:hypothetical protein
MASCAMLFSFSSCDGVYNGGDEDGDDDTEYGYTDIKVAETDDTITFSYNLKTAAWSYDYKIVWKFSNNMCVSCIVTYNCPSEAVALLVKESLNDEDKAKVTVSGKTLTIDCSEEYKEMTKQEISLGVNAMKTQLETAQNQQMGS